jgi:probable addiction module antidote protein
MEKKLSFCYAGGIRAAKLAILPEPRTTGKTTGDDAMPRSRSYKDDLLQALQDPKEAQEYLNAALEDPDPKVFLMALRDVAEAKLGMTQLSEEAGRSRESLDRSLAENGNPELANVRTLLDRLGYRFAIETTAP